jgi:hypothetical protein
MAHLLRKKLLLPMARRASPPRLAAPPTSAVLWLKVLFTTRACLSAGECETQQDALQVMWNVHGTRNSMALTHGAHAPLQQWL